MSLARVRTIILERERGGAWVATLAEVRNACAAGPPQSASPPGGEPRAATVGGDHTSAFLAMNGYGFYIWSAYGVAALALVVELITLRSGRKAILEQARVAALDAADAAGAQQ